MNNNKENINNNEYFSLFYDFLYIEVITNVTNKLYLLFLFFMNVLHLNRKENILEKEIAKPNVVFTITDMNNQFMEKEMDKFVAMFSNDNIKWNENMDEEYYDIELYKKTIEHENSGFELKWKRRTILEHSPRGNIIMYYDVYKKGFAYYCDQQSIPYIILNTLAMKYVRLFMCRDLFVDETIDPQCSPSPLINLEKENVKNDNKSKKENINNKISVDLKQTLKSGPFAKLKKYNQTTTKLEEVVEKNIEKHMNRFLYMGKILNYSFIEKPNKKAKINSILFKGGAGGSGTGIYGAMFEKEHDLQMNVLNYSDFKKKRMNKVE
jgi:hypothetical protein